MRKIYLSAIILFALLQGTFAQFDIMNFYAGVGYNFSNSRLRGINRFVDAYNKEVIHDGFTMNEPMDYIKGIKGHNIVIGYRPEHQLIEINWTRKYGENIAEYTPYTTREIAFKTRTFGLGYFVELAQMDDIGLKIYAGGHMDFIKAKLLTRIKNVDDDDIAWKELSISNGNGNFSLFSPTMKFICTPFKGIPVSLGINTYWQMNWKRHDFSSLDPEMPNNWDNGETLDSLKSSGGNLGIVFQILISPTRIKFEKREKPEKEIIPDITDITIKGGILDSITRNHLNAVVTVTKTDNYGIESEIVNNLPVTGLYDLKVPKASEYKFKIEAFGYEPKEEKIKYYDFNVNTINKNFELNKLAVGQSVKLNNIYFKKASAELLPESFPELDKLYEYLKANQTVEIEIAGHTSSEGADDYNMKLSEDRAASVRAYILKKGIKSERISSKGYGETLPVETNDTEEGRMLNRRVEFKILKN